jgi:hypothetical protein
MQDDEDLTSIEDSIRAVARAITSDAVPNRDAAGGYVASLTEAVMGMTGALMAVAQSIGDLAEAVRERGE